MATIEASDILRVKSGERDVGKPESHKEETGAKTIQRAYQKYKENKPKQKKNDNGGTDEEKESGSTTKPVVNLISSKKENTREMDGFTKNTDKFREEEKEEKERQKQEEELKEKETKRREEELSREAEKCEKQIKEEEKIKAEKEKEKKKEKKRLEEDEEKMRLFKEQRERSEKEKKALKYRKEQAPILHARVHKKFYIHDRVLDCTEKSKSDLLSQDKPTLYQTLEFKDFALFATETKCKEVDFSKLQDKPHSPEKYQKDTDGLEVLSGMRLCVKECTGEDGKDAYKKAFGDGFRENKDSKTPEGYMWIKTVARPSKIEFVHENLSYDNRDQEKGLGDKSWSKDGYRLVWNRYAKRFLKVCSSKEDLKLFANKIAIAANNVSSKNEKWVDLTVFNSLGDSELKTAFIKELLAYGINVLAYEDELPLEFLSSAAEIYQYETKRVRYLEGAPVSKEVLQSKTEECEAQRKNLLTGIREAKDEYSVPENVLYLCSVEDIIREADKNTNLSRLTLPWKGQEDFNSLHPLEGNLAAALGKIASVKSEREWTVFLEGMASEGKVSRELQESIYQAVDWGEAYRRCCYNPVAGTISVVKKEGFSQEWRNAMQACICEETYVNVYSCIFRKAYVKTNLFLLIPEGKKQEYKEYFDKKQSRKSQRFSPIMC